MSELPEGWTTCRLEDAIEDIQAGFASGKKDVKGGLFHLRMNNISVDGKLNLELLRTVPQSLAGQNHYLKEGDVLVCTTNSGKLVGKAALFDLEGRFAFSNHLTRLRANPNTIQSKYLLHQLWLLWKRGDFEHKCKHWVNQSTLPKEELLSSEILLAPLNEQRRIVAKLEVLLSSVDAAQERLATIPGTLKRFRQSVLAAAFSGRLTTEWRESELVGESSRDFLRDISRLRRHAWSERHGDSAIRKYREADAFDPTGLPDVPKSWEWTSADAVCAQITDGEHIQPPYQLEGYPMLSAKHVRDGVVTLEGAGLISEPDFRKALHRCAPADGDILIVSVGATTGRSAIVEKCPSFAIVRSVLLLKPLLSGKLLMRWLQAPWCFRWMTQASGASAQPHLYIKDTKRMPVPIPPPREQKQIVRRVEELFKTADALEARYRTAKAHVDKLTQSILAKAFRGQLVPQDPNDEPASVLLERIRKVKAAEVAKKVKRSK